MLIQVCTPVSLAAVEELKVGNLIEISGALYTGRDAALPLLAKRIREDRLSETNLNLDGAIVFHSAVSPAGIGPTTSSKVEIEESIPVLARAGVRIHIGKGSISQSTSNALREARAVFAVTPPVSALLTRKVKCVRVVAFENEGMEAMYELEVEKFPAIIAVAWGRSIYEPRM